MNISCKNACIETVKIIVSKRISVGVLRSLPVFLYHTINLLTYTSQLVQYEIYFSRQNDSKNKSHIELGGSNIKQSLSVNSNRFTRKEYMIHQNLQRTVRKEEYYTIFITHRSYYPLLLVTVCYETINPSEALPTETIKSFNRADKSSTQLTRIHIQSMSSLKRTGYTNLLRKRTKKVMKFSRKQKSFEIAPFLCSLSVLLHR